MIEDTKKKAGVGVTVAFKDEMIRYCNYINEAGGFDRGYGLVFGVNKNNWNSLYLQCTTSNHTCSNCIWDPRECRKGTLLSEDPLRKFIQMDDGMKLIKETVLMEKTEGDPLNAVFDINALNLASSMLTKEQFRSFSLIAVVSTGINSELSKYCQEKLEEFRDE